MPSLAIPSVIDSNGRVKKRWNWSLWVGFLFVLAGFLSYPFFARFPITRDFPWANFLLFGFGGIFLLVGLVRAFGKPQSYRGKIVGPDPGGTQRRSFWLLFVSDLLRAAAVAIFNRSAARR
jgi:hypothetical protein